MNPQLPLAIGLRPVMRLGEFVVGSNAQPVAALQAMLDGGEQSQIFLGGAPASGKTHLLVGACEVWEREEHGDRDDRVSTGRSVYIPLCGHADYRPELLEGLEQHGLIAIDDLQAIAGRDDWELALFNLYNRARAAGCRLLLAADRGPTALPVRLADLGSRLAWGLSFQLQPLSDDDKLGLLQRQAERRGLELSGEAARYILDRHSRDLPSLLALLERLDQASLAEQRRLTLPFVRAQLTRESPPTDHSAV